MLEDHVVLFIWQWRVGLGVMGELGTENIHNRFNVLERTYSNMPNKVNWLKCMVADHFRQVFPANIVKLPPAVKRAKRGVNVTLHLSSYLYSLIMYEIVNFSFFTLYSLLLLSFFLYLKSVPIYVIVHVLFIIDLYIISYPYYYLCVTHRLGTQLLFWQQYTMSLPAWTCRGIVHICTYMSTDIYTNHTLREIYGNFHHCITTRKTIGKSQLSIFLPLSICIVVTEDGRTPAFDRILRDDLISATL